jgi:L-histidine N-alpha-methyltransferase
MREEPVSRAGVDEGRVEVRSYVDADGLEAMAEDVRRGLTARPMRLPSKYFYDARGSELFELITEQPEYYQTRSERLILNRRATEIATATGATDLVELGSGSASKTRALLYALAGAGTLERYVPIDVSETTVERCARELVQLFPGLTVHGMVADFGAHLEHVPDGERRLFAFLGGTIGNLRRAERVEFLGALAELMLDGDALLLGVDLVKERAVLEAAYDDDAGVTREFNRNILHAINLALGADFLPEDFDHVSFFDADAGWIEMRLRARAHQRVSIPGADLELDIAAGEEIHTEISAKFSRGGLSAELGEAGLGLRRFFTDDEGLFGLALAAARS